MRVALVNPPRTMHDTREIGPSLSLLMLASSVKHFADVRIFDFNLSWHLDPALRTDFYERAVLVLLEYSADIYGFTSMAVDSHVALELARRLKKKDSAVRIVLGGAHFTSIAAEVKEFYPWVDEVITGEGESAFAQIVAVRSRGDSLSLGATTNSPYDGVDLSEYFRVNPRRYVDFEAGRGCRFNCSFCYSPTFWRAVRIGRAHV